MQVPQFFLLHIRPGLCIMWDMESFFFFLIIKFIFI